jgi:hypothetical protein
MKRIAIPLLVLATATSGFAESRDSAWALRLGILIPRLGNISGITVDTGASFSVAYRAFKSDTMSLEIESLGSAYSISDGFGESATINVSNLNLVFLTHTKDSQFYYGAALGSAKPSATLNGYVFDGQTSTVYGPVLGTKLPKGWFLEARYMFCTVPASRGTMILAGYRF